MRQSTAAFDRGRPGVRELVHGLAVIVVVAAVVVSRNGRVATTEAVFSDLSTGSSAPVAARSGEGPDSSHGGAKFAQPADRRDRIGPASDSAGP